MNSWHSPVDPDCPEVAIEDQINQLLDKYPEEEFLAT